MSKKVLLLGGVVLFTAGLMAQVDEPPVDKRIAGVLPNYRTANLADTYTPISTHRKLVIACKDSFDYPLVGLGASLITMVCAFLPDPAAMSRAIQGIIAGVGFLGGGAILKSTDVTVSGLTTAASIWVVASLGIACGAGQWVMAIIALVTTLIVLVAGNAVEAFFRNR